MPCEMRILAQKIFNENLATNEANCHNNLNFFIGDKINYKWECNSGKNNLNMIFYNNL